MAIASIFSVRHLTCPCQIARAVKRQQVVVKGLTMLCCHLVIPPVGSLEIETTGSHRLVQFLNKWEVDLCNMEPHSLHVFLYSCHTYGYILYLQSIILNLKKKTFLYPFHGVEVLCVRESLRLKIPLLFFQICICEFGKDNETKASAPLGWISAT